MPTVTRLIVSVLTVLAVVSLGARGASVPVHADDATPTAAPAIETPLVTPMVTEIVPTVGNPVVHREKTAIPVPTAVPLASPTHALPGAAPTVPAASPPAASSSLLPSPADLRRNARLRWGRRVPPAVRRWAYLIVPAATRYHVDPNLVAAVITMESAGDPRAWNVGSDARGLMQVLHAPFDPAENIEEGTRMLRGFLDEFHSVPIALAAYNAGPAAVQSFGGIPPYRETRDYVIIVTYLYDLYSHHALTGRRKAQFSATVHDLRHFKNQRKKVGLLSLAASTPPAPETATCSSAHPCESSFDQRVFPSMDPFWPMPGQPDPLQRVGPDLVGAPQ